MPEARSPREDLVAVVLSSFVCVFCCYMYLHIIIHRMFRLLVYFHVAVIISSHALSCLDYNNVIRHLINKLT